MSRPPRPTTTARRGPATVPAKAPAVAPTTDERRKALVLSKHPGRDRAIGIAFWAGFAFLVLHYAGAIPWGQPTAADIWPPRATATGSR
ncbi:hypothetical protein GXW78_26520 [Roseomonas terrae]|uniref:Uncharacterized protein n=1 Tax=Neoroseomonas terrae TaxID=424799 RepID=A0ABS5EQC0_9PROT|nr:hypothetical protein [Neoroseomonas terrae]MBR0653235.1 hypothetical protein [Neoroseomonas terrae]